MNTNPNNCATCDYSKMGATGGWCYMWRSEPKTVCISHTGRRSERIAKIIVEAEKEAEDLSQWLMASASPIPFEENTDGNQD